jgi:hypothetical protein
MRPRLVALVVLAALAAPASALGLAGGSTGSGGGSSGGSSSGSSFSSSRAIDCSSGCNGGLGIGFVIVGGGFLLFGGVMLGVKLSGRKWEKRLRTVEDQLNKAHDSDRYWAPNLLRARVRECFFPVQSSWEERDVTASRPFVSDALYERHTLQLEGLEQQGRVNHIQDLQIQDLALVGFHNVEDDGEDHFVARIRCTARDWMEDVDTRELINGSQELSEFVQFWTFARHPEYGWVLDEIQQETEGEYHLSAAVVDEDHPAAL